MTDVAPLVPEWVVHLDDEAENDDGDFSDLTDYFQVPGVDASAAGVVAEILLDRAQSALLTGRWDISDADVSSAQAIAGWMYRDPAYLLSEAKLDVCVSSLYGALRGATADDAWLHLIRSDPEQEPRLGRAALATLRSSRQAIESEDWVAMNAARANLRKMAELAHSVSVLGAGTHVLPVPLTVETLGYTSLGHPEPARAVVLMCPDCQRADGLKMHWDGTEVTYACPGDHRWPEPAFGVFWVLQVWADARSSAASTPGVTPLRPRR